jgi:hypothetical protein
MGEEKGTSKFWILCEIKCPKFNPCRWPQKLTGRPCVLVRLMKHWPGKANCAWKLWNWATVVMYQALDTPSVSDLYLFRLLVLIFNMFLLQLRISWGNQASSKRCRPVGPHHGQGTQIALTTIPELVVLRDISWNVYSYSPGEGIISLYGTVKGITMLR